MRAADDRFDVGEGARQTEALHDSQWALAEEAGKQDAGSITAGLFIQALNEVIDLHLKRVTVSIRNRVPAPIWATLYLLVFIGMLMLGTQIGLSGTRHIGMELALAVSFAVVLFVIADLDRPQEGLINVSQQAMHELHAGLNVR